MSPFIPISFLARLNIVQWRSLFNVIWDYKTLITFMLPYPRNGLRWILSYLSPSIRSSLNMTFARITDNIDLNVPLYFSHHNFLFFLSAMNADVSIIICKENFNLRLFFIHVLDVFSRTQSMWLFFFNMLNIVILIKVREKYDMENIQNLLILSGIL